MQAIIAALMSAWALFKSLPGLTGGVWVFLKALPSLAKLALEIFKLLHQVKDYYDRWALVKEFKGAVELARTTGDTSELERVISGKPKVKTSEEAQKSIPHRIP